MNLALTVSLVSAGLFLGMLTAYAGGRRLGAARLARTAESPEKGASPVEAAVVGLMGLIVAFTFFGAGARFEARHLLVGQEANAIGTAWLRIDSLPADAQPELRDLFRSYVDKRVETYLRIDDASLFQADLAEGAALQGRIWSTALSACRRPGVPVHAPILLLPALNDMIDITTTRTVAMQNHPPMVIYVLLVGLSLLGSLLSGYIAGSTNARCWFHVLVLASTMSVTLYVILDLEYPRLGLIRVDAVDQTLVDLRRSMR